MPAPPPNGVSSTRAVPVGGVGRGCRAPSSDHRPRLQRAPGQRMAERAGKALGKQGQHAGAPGGGSWRRPPARRPAPAISPGGATVMRPAARSTAGTAARVNGTQQRGRSPGWRRRRSRAPPPPGPSGAPSASTGLQPDQVGEVVLVGLRRRQAGRARRRARRLTSFPAAVRSATGTGPPSMSSASSATPSPAPAQREAAAGAVVRTGRTPAGRPGRRCSCARAPAPARHAACRSRPSGCAVSARKAVPAAAGGGLGALLRLLLRQRTASAARRHRHRRQAGMAEEAWRRGRSASAPWLSQCRMRSLCRRTRSACSAGSIGL